MSHQISSKLTQCLRGLVFICSLFMVQLSFAESEQDISEPEVVIKQSDDKKISEYYVNGVLVEIKVEPKNAPTYYLVPAEGGMVRMDESQLLVPGWKILEW